VYPSSCEVYVKMSDHPSKIAFPLPPPSLPPIVVHSLFRLLLQELEVEGRSMQQRSLRRALVQHRLTQEHKGAGGMEEEELMWQDNAGDDDNEWPPREDSVLYHLLSLLLQVVNSQVADLTGTCTLLTHTHLRRRRMMHILCALIPLLLLGWAPVRLLACAVE
jgi:hypothetical protein